MGKQRVATSQVFLHASESRHITAPFPLYPWGCTTPWGTLYPHLLWRASPSQTASAPAQTQKNSLARCKLPLGPGWITGLELGIPARVTPCSQRCWASTVLQPCCGAGRCPPHLHPLAKETRRKETPLKLLEGGDGGSAWLGSCRGRGQAQHFCIAPCSSPQGLGQRQGAVAVLLRSRMALAVTDDMLQNHLKIDSRRASLKAYYLH